MATFKTELRGAFVLALLLVGTALYGQSSSVNLFIDPSPNPVGPNADITYSIVVSSEGPDDAQNMSMTFTAPPTTSFQSLSSPVGWSCNPPAVGTTNTVITCTLATFPPGSSTFTVVMRVPANAANGSVLDATATVTSTTSDPDSDDNTDTKSVTVQSVSDLGVDKSGPATVIAGDTFSYTLSVSNNGPNSADATLIDTFASDPLFHGNLTFVSISSNAGWSCSPAIGTVTCTNPSFAPGTVTFTLTVKVAMYGDSSVTNDVSISSTSVDNVQPNNQDSVTSAVIRRADLDVTKSGPATVAPGSDIAYTIVVTNNGPTNAETATLTDNVTRPFVSITSDPGWNCTTPAVGATGLLTCTISVLPAVGSFTLTVHSSDPGGTVITNTAQASTSTPDPVSSNNSATATTTVSSSPASLTVTKTIASGSAVAGTNVTYSVVITNNGPSTQFDNPGNEMDDQLPAGLTLISANATSGTAVADLPNNRVSWNGSIPNGGTVTVTIVARIDDIRASNQATVHYDADGNGTNESSATSAAASFGVAVPFLTPAMLAMLAAMLLVLAMRRV